MVSLVEELQSEAIKPTVAASDLLRKALVVATRLDIREMRDWIRCELDGYVEGQPVPAYRQIRGQLMMYNPVRGWVPVSFPTSEVERNYTVRFLREPIGTIEHLAQ